MSCITRKPNTNEPDLEKKQVSSFFLVLHENGHAQYVPALALPHIQPDMKLLSRSLDVHWERTIKQLVDSVLKGPIKELAEYFGLDGDLAVFFYERCAHKEFLYAPCLCGGESFRMTYQTTGSKRKGEKIETPGTYCHRELNCGLYLASHQGDRARVSWTRRPVPMCPWCYEEKLKVELTLDCGGTIPDGMGPSALFCRRCQRSMCKVRIWAAQLRAFLERCVGKEIE